MAVQINYKNSASKNVSSNLVLFVDEKFSINPIKNHITNIEYNYISDLLKVSNLTKNLIVFELSSKKNNFSFN